MIANAIGVRAGILIPTFNRCGYLRLALASALAQTHPNLDVLVMDNASEDGTADFMASVSDRRVRYVRNPRNLGMIGSINAGMRLFREDVTWCSILADDDLLDPDFVRAGLARAADSNARTVINGRRVFVDATGSRLRDALDSPPEEGALEYLESRAERRRETYLTGVLFTRNAFDACGGYPVFATGLATDDALIFALALRDRLVYAPDAISLVRFHPDAESLTARDGLNKLLSMDEFCEYCVRAFSALENPTSGLARLERALQQYRFSIKSYVWRQAFEGAKNGTDGYSASDVSALFAFVRRRPQDFSRWIQLKWILHRVAGLGRAS
jgi:glycosyltransferase involved in cell wall biosynthesis